MLFNLLFHGINKDTFILYLVSILHLNLVVPTVSRLNPESEFNIKSNQINLFKLGEEWLPDLPSQRLMYQTCEHSGSNWNLEVLAF